MKSLSASRGRGGNPISALVPSCRRIACIAGLIECIVGIAPFFSASTCNSTKNMSLLAGKPSTVQTQKWTVVAKVDCSVDWHTHTNSSQVHIALKDVWCMEDML
uniref:Uncharacterized protein n=1 Tax=Eutreptiella gymnastica TaxID=73025 RepID=A0A7S4FZ44_9EUGL